MDYVGHVTANILVLIEVKAMIGYEAKDKLHQERIHKYYIERLKELGVTHSQLGHKVDDLDIEEAHYELVLAEIRAVEVSNESSKWF